jgi:anti-sigma factor RsiW
MSQCSYQSSLDAYHDGQAPQELAQELARHLPTCAACSAELTRLSQLSQLLGTARPEGIRPDELTRVHEAVEEVEHSGSEDRGIIRLMVGLSAVAASILIISGAWLYDAPQPASHSLSQGQPVSEQAWERMASAGQTAGPIDVPPVGVARVNDRSLRDTADWMVVGMGGPVEHGSR